MVFLLALSYRLPGRPLTAPGCLVGRELGKIAGNPQVTTGVHQVVTLLHDATIFAVIEILLGKPLRQVVNTLNLPCSIAS